jgi:transposase
MGWYRPVHRESLDAQEVRALLAGRKLLQAKLRDVELSICGLLRGFGLKVGEVSKGQFTAGVAELLAGHEMLEAVIGAMLRARGACGPSSRACTGGCWPSSGTTRSAAG